MTENDFREEAEQHWKFAEQFIIKLSKWKNAPKIEDGLLELIQFLYVEAMIHGYKHAVEEIKE